MSTALRHLIIGNGTVHGTRVSEQNLQSLGNAAADDVADLTTAPPFTLAINAARAASGMLAAALRNLLVFRGGTCTIWRTVYGGSNSPANLSALATTERLDALLICMASLRAADFTHIIAPLNPACQSTWGQNARNMSKVGARE